MNFLQTPKILLLLALLAIPTSLAFLSTPAFAASAFTIKLEKGQILSLIETMKEKMPQAGSEGYVRPTTGEMQLMHDLVAKVLLWMQTGDMDNLQQAARAGSQIGYLLINFTDTDSQRVYLILQEVGPTTKGWGNYIFHVKKAGIHKNLIIEVPHPLFDVNTPEIGILSYVRSEAGFFLLAGAHRYANMDGSSDVAWAPASMFLTVHKVVSVRDSVAVQIHGFVRTQARQTYPEIILSTGDGRTTGVVASLASSLMLRNFSVGTYDGVNYSDLKGNNQESAYSRSASAVFLHMEIERAIRVDPQSYSRVADAIGDFGNISVIDVPEFMDVLTLMPLVLISVMTTLLLLRRRVKLWKK